MIHMINIVSIFFLYKAHRFGNLYTCIIT